MSKTYEILELTNMERLHLYDKLSRYMNRPGCNLQISIPGEPLVILLGADTFAGINFGVEISDGQALDLLEQALKNLQDNVEQVKLDIASVHPVDTCGEEEA